MKQWFVVHTQPSKETVAQRHLSEQCYDAYLPRFKKIHRHARNVEEVVATLFPRYLFAGMGMQVDQWRNIQGTRGDSYLIVNHNHPSAIPSGIIQSLRKREKSAECVSMDNLALFTKDDKVRVIEGVFKN